MSECTRIHRHDVRRPNWPVVGADFWNRGKDLRLSARITSKNRCLWGQASNDQVRIDYEQYAWGVVDAIWAKFPVDIFESEFAEVIGALLARNAILLLKSRGIRTYGTITQGHCSSDR